MGGGAGSGSGSGGGLSASKRAMQQVRESTDKKKKSFDPATIAEIQTIEAEEAAASEEEAVAEAEEDSDAPKGPIGKILKTVNDRAADATKEDADRFAEASASAVAAATADGAEPAPLYRASEEGAKRKKRVKPAQKKKKKKKGAK